MGSYHGALLKRSVDDLDSFRSEAYRLLELQTNPEREDEAISENMLAQFGQKMRAANGTRR